MTFGRYRSWDALDLEMEETLKKENSLKQKLICPLVALFSRTVSLYWITFTEVPSSKGLWELMPRVSKLEITFGVIPWAKRVLRDDLAVPSIRSWANHNVGGSLWQVVDLGGMDLLTFG